MFPPNWPPSRPPSSRVVPSKTDEEILQDALSRGVVPDDQVDMLRDIMDSLEKGNRPSHDDVSAFECLLHILWRFLKQDLLKKELHRVVLGEREETSFCEGIDTHESLP